MKLAAHLHLVSMKGMGTAALPLRAERKLLRFIVDITLQMPNLCQT